MHMVLERTVQILSENIAAARQAYKLTIRQRAVRCLQPKFEVCSQKHMYI